MARLDAARPRVRLALDTSAYSDLQSGNERLRSELAAAELVGLPIIVIGELWFGFMQGRKLRENGQTLERFAADPRVAVLHVDEVTAHRFGSVFTDLRRTGVPIQQNDVWIAALCLQHGYTLATRDRGFTCVVGLSVLELD